MRREQHRERFKKKSERQKKSTFLLFFFFADDTQKSGGNVFVYQFFFLCFLYASLKYLYLLDFFPRQTRREGRRKTKKEPQYEKMGFFGKIRHGKMEVVAPGRRFQWSIPNVDKQAHGSVLDSDIVTSFAGAEFHFHMVICKNGDLGFYIHYKSPPVPKYTYTFHSNIRGQELRQQTAHTIPPDIEKCGHWNVCSRDVLLQLLADGNRTLYVDFEFDDDTITKSGVEDIRISWVVPRMSEKRCNPLTSSGFGVNGSVYVLRLDTKSNGDGVIFVFARAQQIVQHSIVLHGVDGEPVASVERKEEMGPQSLVVPRELLQSATKHQQLRVTLILYRSSNPLDMFNNISRSQQVVSAVENRRTTTVGNSQYVVVGDDEV